MRSKTLLLASAEFVLALVSITNFVPAEFLATTGGNPRIAFTVLGISGRGGHLTFAILTRMAKDKLNRGIYSRRVAMGQYPAMLCSSYGADKGCYFRTAGRRILALAVRSSVLER